MMNRRGFTCASVAVFVMGAGNLLAHEPAAGGCGVFSRDVTHELAVMRSAAIPVTAESGTGAQPRLALDKHYALSLLAQKQLRLPFKPGREARTESPRGGAFQFTVPASGRYRISITSRHWIDVLDGESVVESADHFGPACNVLHKIVEFDLSPGRKFTLQVSGQDDAIIGLAITAAPYAQKQSGT
jgi:hypothetical protein